MGASASRKIHTADGMLLIGDDNLTKQGAFTWSTPRDAIEGASFAQRDDGNDMQLHMRDGSRVPLYGVSGADVLRIIEAVGYKGGTLLQPRRPAPAVNQDTDDTAELVVPCARGQVVVTGTHIRLTGQSSWEVRRADVTRIYPHVTRSGCALGLAMSDGRQLTVNGMAHGDTLDTIGLLGEGTFRARVTPTIKQPTEAHTSSPPTVKPSRPGRGGSGRQKKSLQSAPNPAEPIPIETHELNRAPAAKRATQSKGKTAATELRPAENGYDASKPPATVMAPFTRRAWPAPVGGSQSMPYVPTALGAHYRLHTDPAMLQPDAEPPDKSCVPEESRAVLAAGTPPTPLRDDAVARVDDETGFYAWRPRDTLVMVLGALIFVVLAFLWVRTVVTFKSPIASTAASTATDESTRSPMPGEAAQPLSTVYVGSDDGALYALTTRDGTLLWRQMTGGAVESCPTYAGGVVYAGSDDGLITAVQATDRAVLWRVRTGGRVIGAPAVANGIVYAGSADHSLYAMQASNGKLLWRYRADNWFASQPTVAEGLLYAGNYDGNIYALDARSGALRWTFHAGASVATVPAVADGVVYAGSSNGVVYALNAQTGALEWRYATSGSVYSSPVVVGGVLYVGSFDGAVYAFSIRERKVLWRYQTDGPVVSSPVVVGGVLYVGSFDGAVYALNADSGAVEWHFKTGNSVAASPAVANDTIYIGSGDHAVYALTASTGRLLWYYRTGGVVTWRPALGT